MHIADIGFGANNHAAATRCIGTLNAIFTENDPAGGEIRSFDKLVQFFDGGIRIIDQMVDAFTNLGKVVRGNIRRHTDGDA